MDFQTKILMHEDGFKSGIYLTLTLFRHNKMLMQSYALKKSKWWWNDKDWFKIPMEQLSKMSLNQVNHQQTINKLTVSLNDGRSQRLQDSLQWLHYRLKIQDIEVSWDLFILWQLLLRMQEANSWISTELEGQDEPFWLVYRKSGTQRACMSDIDSSVKKGYQKHQTTKSSNSVVLSCCPGVTQNCTFWILQDQNSLIL